MRGLRSTPAIRFIQSIPSTWKGHELFAIWIVKKIRPKVVVDIGFDQGLSTIAFAHRNLGHTFGIDWIGDENILQKRTAMETAFHNISAAIRLNYVKNIHLIVGPIKEISQRWDRKIDLLHIDGAQKYEEIKEHYQHWKPFLTKDAVLLIHDVESLSKEVGKFFSELPLHKFLFLHNKGLGIATNNASLCQAIEAEWGDTVLKP